MEIKEEKVKERVIKISGGDGGRQRCASRTSLRPITANLRKTRDSQWSEQTVVASVSGSN